MKEQFIFVDLDKEQKAIIVDEAWFYVSAAEAKEDLKN